MIPLGRSGKLRCRRVALGLVFVCGAVSLTVAPTSVRAEAVDVDPQWKGTVKTVEAYTFAGTGVLSTARQVTTYEVNGTQSRFSSTYSDRVAIDGSPCGTLIDDYSGEGQGLYETLRFAVQEKTLGSGQYVANLFGDDDHFHDGLRRDQICSHNGAGWVTQTNERQQQSLVYPPRALGCEDTTFIVPQNVQAIRSSLNRECEQAGRQHSSTWTYEMKLDPCDPAVDSDGGGMGDCYEFIAGTNTLDPSDDGNGDFDNDGVLDGPDNCDFVHNANQADLDGDAIGDACDTDIDGDGLPNDEEVVTDPRDADSDDDSFDDKTDNCPSTSNPDQVDTDKDGVGDACEEGCARDDATDRGYTVAHYDADLGALVAPDPDFFDWEVSAAWCVVDNVVRIKQADSSPTVTLNTGLATALDAVGVTFLHDIDDPDSFVNSFDAATGRVDASTDFDACVNPLSLIASAPTGGVLGRLSERVASRLMGRVPAGQTAAAWLDTAVQRIDRAALQNEEALLRAMKRRLTRIGNLIPDRIELILQFMLTDRLASVRDALLNQNSTESLFHIANSGFSRFLDVYGDDAGRIVIPRRDRAEARSLWLQIVGEVANGAGSMISDALNAEWCSTVWRPVLTLYIPKAGDSFVDDSAIDRSIFDVKGGVSIDERP